VFGDIGELDAVGVIYLENNASCREQDVAGGLREVVAAVAGDQFGDPAELEPPAADDVQAATRPRTRRVSRLLAHVEDRAEQISGVGLLPREDHARLRG